MVWYTGDIENFVLELKSKLGHQTVALTTPKTPSEELTPTVVQTQKVPYIAKIDPRKKFID